VPSHGATPARRRRLAQDPSGRNGALITAAKCVRLHLNAEPFMGEADQPRDVSSVTDSPEPAAIPLVRLPERFLVLPADHALDVQPPLPVPSWIPECAERNRELRRPSVCRSRRGHSPDAPPTHVEL